MGNAYRYIALNEKAYNIQYGHIQNITYRYREDAILLRFADPCLFK
jgi:hypothetical protein